MIRHINKNEIDTIYITNHKYIKFISIYTNCVTDYFEAGLRKEIELTDTGWEDLKKTRVQLGTRVWIHMMVMWVNTWFIPYWIRLL